VLSWIWLGIVLVSVLWAALWSGEMAAVTAAVTDGARAAVTLVIGLVGIMVFFLGLTRVAFDGGLRDAFAHALRPVTRRLFPEDVFAEWGRRDPIGCYEEALKKKPKLLGARSRKQVETKLAAWEEEVAEEVERAAEHSLRSRDRHPPDPEAMLGDVFAGN